MSPRCTVIGPVGRDPASIGPVSADYFVRLVVLFYAAMLVVAVVWALARGRALAEVVVWGEPMGIGWQLLLGLSSGAGVIVLTRALEARSEALRRLSDRLASLVPPLSRSQAIGCAIASAVGEEAFFRGAMQDQLGPWVTVVLFGLLHGGSERRLWGWTVFALMGGALFAGLFYVGGTLAAPIVAHAVVNAVNLHALGDRPRGRADAPDDAPQVARPQGALASPEIAASERQDVG